MNIAVTYRDGQIFQHFGQSEQFKIYSVKDGKIESSLIVDAAGDNSRGALPDLLKKSRVDTLICGGIGESAKDALFDVGIRQYGGVSGDCDQAVELLLSGTLPFDPNVKCGYQGTRRYNQNKNGMRRCGQRQNGGQGCSPHHNGKQGCGLRHNGQQGYGPHQYGANKNGQQGDGSTQNGQQSNGSRLNGQNSQQDRDPRQNGQRDYGPRQNGQRNCGPRHNGQQGCGPRHQKNEDQGEAHRYRGRCHSNRAN